MNPNERKLPETGLRSTEDVAQYSVSLPDADAPRPTIEYVAALLREPGFVDVNERQRSGDDAPALAASAATSESTPRTSRRRSSTHSAKLTKTTRDSHAAR